MKLTIQLRLLPTLAQASVLRLTMRQFNAAATFAARTGFDAGVFGQQSIHKLAYYPIREQFGLSAQLAIHAVFKAAECFKRDKTRCPEFRSDGSITYDERNMSFKGVDKVSLSTLSGREIIAMVYGEYQAERFDRIKGQCDLVCRDGKFYLLATIEMPEATPIEIKEFVGVDLGLVNVASCGKWQPKQLGFQAVWRTGRAKPQAAHDSPEAISAKGNKER